MMMEQSRVINERLEQSVPEYYSKNPAARWLFRQRLNTAVSFMAKADGKNIIDLGCGDGLLIQYVLDAGIKPLDFQAIDIHPEVIRLNGTLKGCRFSCQKLEQTDFADGQFDTATCLDVLEHFEDLSAPVHEIRRIVKPGGYLITSEPTETGFYKLLRFVLKGYFSKPDEKSIDYHFQNAASVEKALVDGGFKPVARRTLPLPFPLDLFHIELFERCAGPSEQR
jgi:2-polyprenyl-3-methyl-5-hydroxy-6-metoxy-1,4-benzoquinol methylase